MDIEEAVVAAAFIECDNIMGVHFDSFEMIEIDHEKSKQIFKNKNKTLNLLGIGEHLTV
jgi:L-ascorbate metabolism protein UlaG (beta-lactamase superfamily)